jgi:hypothetical protein
MKTIKLIDPIELSVLAVEAALRNLLLTGVAKHLVRLAGISEKWVGRPGWFLWFDNLPGAFLVELTGALNSESSDKGSGLFSRFRIKHYPAGKAEDPSFMALSADEKRARMSDMFDDTGTPVVDMQDKIGDYFFVSGNICMNTDGGRLHYFCACSKEGGVRFCEYSDCCRQGGTASALLSMTGYKGGGGNWESTWNVLDRLLLSFCCANKSEIASAALYRARPNISLLENLLAGLLMPQSGQAGRGYVICGKSTVAAKAGLQHIRARTFDLEQVAFCDGNPGQSEYSMWFNPLWWEIGSAELEKEHVHFGCAHE